MSAGEVEEGDSRVGEGLGVCVGVLHVITLRN